MLVFAFVVCCFLWFECWGGLFDCLVAGLCCVFCVGWFLCGFLLLKVLRCLAWFKRLGCWWLWVGVWVVVCVGGFCLRLTDAFVGCLGVCVCLTVLELGLGWVRIWICVCLGVVKFVWLR